MRRIVLVVCLVLPFTLGACRKKAAVGQPCKGPDGCVKGADCLVTYSGVIPPLGATHGVCFQTCLRDSECPTGNTCHQAHCRVVAPVGGECQESTPCALGGACIREDGAVRAFCRRECVVDSSCAAGEACLPVGGPDAAMLTSGGLGLQRVCVVPPPPPR